MRIALLAAALIAGLPPLAAPAPAGAADPTLKALRCNVGVRKGSRPCTAVTLREDVANGRLTILLAFDDGFRLEIAGPSIAAGGRDRTMEADTVTWANPGQTNPRVDANTDVSRVVRGVCVVSKFKGTDQIGSVGCDLSAASVGRIGVAFRAEPPPKD